MRDLEPNEDRDLAFKICDFLDMKKAENIELFYVSHLSNLTDYFVIATASSTTQAKALSDYIEENLVKSNIRVLRRDGVNEWIVLDYNSVIIHIFTPEVRDFYHIEKLWNDGKNGYNLSTIKKLLEKEEKTKNQKIHKAEKAEKQLLEKEEKTKQKEEKKSKK